MIDWVFSAARVKLAADLWQAACKRWLRSMATVCIAGIVATYMLARYKQVSVDAVWKLLLLPQSVDVTWKLLLLQYCQRVEACV